MINSFSFLKIQNDYTIMSEEKKPKETGKIS